MAAGRLTEFDWLRVFDIRCASKKGSQLSPEERELLNTAFAQDRSRYTAMSTDVFRATAPFGSQIGEET